MTAVFEEMKRLRMEAGLTQDQMAERTGLTPNYIGQIERGYRDPSRSTLEAMAKALGVTLAAVFEPRPALSPPAIEVAEIVAAVPRDVQTGILALLRALTRRQRRQARPAIDDEQTPPG